MTQVILAPLAVLGLLVYAVAVFAAVFGLVAAPSLFDNWRDCPRRVIACVFGWLLAVAIAAGPLAGMDAAPG